MTEQRVDTESPAQRLERMMAAPILAGRPDWERPKSPGAPSAPAASRLPLLPLFGPPARPRFRVMPPQPAMRRPRTHGAPRSVAGADRRREPG